MLPDRERPSEEKNDFASYRREFIDYFKDAKIGSGKYQAFFDCSHLQDLYDDRGRVIKRTSEGSTTGEWKSREELESDLRILEGRIVLQETQMQQKAVTLPDYLLSRYRIEGGIEGVFGDDFDYRREWDNIITDITDNLHRNNP